MKFSADRQSQSCDSALKDPVILGVWRSCSPLRQMAPEMLPYLREGCAYEKISEWWPQDAPL